MENNTQGNSVKKDVLWFIFFWPVGIYRIWKNPQYGKVIKYGATGFLVCVSVTSFIINPPTASRSVASNTFSPSMVKLTDVSSMNKGGLIKVYLVARKGNPYEVSKECVSHYSSEYKSVACYAFRGEKEYTTSKVTKQGMEKTCYAAAFSKTFSGSVGVDIKENNKSASYLADKCGDQ